MLKFKKPANWEVEIGSCLVRSTWSLNLYQSMGFLPTNICCLLFVYFAVFHAVTLERWNTGFLFPFARDGHGEQVVSSKYSSTKKGTSQEFLMSWRGRLIFR
jgi:hypothetical protein